MEKTTAGNTVPTNQGIFTTPPWPMKRIFTNYLVKLRQRIFPTCKHPKNHPVKLAYLWQSSCHLAPKGADLHSQPSQYEPSNFSLKKNIVLSPVGLIKHWFCQANNHCVANLWTEEMLKSLNEIKAIVYS